MAGTDRNFKHRLLENTLYSIDQFEIFPIVLNKIVQCRGDISFCNASETFSFTEAICRVRREPKTNGDGNLLKLRNFKNIFQVGVDVLQHYVRDNLLPKEKGAKIAMENLLGFFDEFSKPEAARNLYRAVHNVKHQSEVIIILVHHLLSQLAVSGAYTIDQRSKGSKSNKCPCCSKQLSGTFGDTSIGNSSVWHGRLDTLLGPISIKCTSSFDNDEKNDDDERQDDILKHRKIKDQLRAQNIVFAFLQRRFHPDLPHFMVPHIGISEDTVQLYFYDSEHDILVEARQEQLFVSEEEINMKTVVGLWLVINYKIFCSGVTEEMKNGGFTAGFLNNDPEKRKIYEDELQFGCGDSSFERDVNLDYKADHCFLEFETPLKKRRVDLKSEVLTPN